MTDPIADFLTRIRNAVKANHKVVEAPGSKIKQEITKILYEQGYILAYKFDTDEKGHPSIKIALKWDAATKGNAIKDLKRCLLYTSRASSSARAVRRSTSSRKS